MAQCKSNIMSMHNVKEQLITITTTTNAFGQQFRAYDSGQGERITQVEQFYKKNHINQSFDFVERMRKKHLSFNKGMMSVWECAELLNEFVDESDPDLDEPQIEHLLQTAEAIRRDYPEQDWFHLTAFIHDLGKVLLHPKFGEEPQWAVVGDTFPVGCAFDESLLYHKYFRDNPDLLNPEYNTKNGIYEQGCGLDNLTMSWGHDEYMYQVMKENNSTLPPQAFFIIRYHSFSALYRKGAYMDFMNSFDREMLPWLKTFANYDLYSKSKTRVDVDKVKPYYLSLIQKYFPANKLRW